MKLTPLLEEGTNKAFILKLQQQVLEHLPHDVDVTIETHAHRRSTWRLRCKLFDRPNDVGVVVGMGAQVTEGYCHYIVANLLKPELKALGFDTRGGGRFFLSRADRREYTGLLTIDSGAEDDAIPFRIIARHHSVPLTTIFAIAQVYSFTGLKQAVKFLDEFDFKDSSGQDNPPRKVEL